MRQPSFADTTLILLGHGTTLNAESAAPVFQHASELRRRQVFADVREAFWKQEPRVTHILAGVRTARAIIVPFFISEGYFSEQVIPAELGFSEALTRPENRVLRRGSQACIYARPVGTHEKMTEVILDRAREVVRRFPFPTAPKESEITLFLAGHGTGQNENSRQAIERQADVIRSRSIYPAVRAVFLEEQPSIPSCYGLAQTRSMVMVPFFISDGLHVAEDIPVLLGEPEAVVRRRVNEKKPSWRNPTEKHGKLLWYTQSVGTDPVMTEVILARAQEAAGWV